MLGREGVTSLVRIAIFQLGFLQIRSPYQLPKITNVYGVSLFAYEDVSIGVLGYSSLIG